MSAVCSDAVVPAAGVEPARVISPTDFESVTSANSITPACASHITITFSRLQALFPSRRGPGDCRSPCKLSAKCRQLERHNQNCLLIVQGYNVKGDYRPPSQIPHAYRNPARRVCLRSEGAPAIAGAPSLLFSLFAESRSKPRHYMGLALMYSSSSSISEPRNQNSGFSSLPAALSARACFTLSGVAGSW